MHGSTRCLRAALLLPVFSWSLSFSHLIYPNDRLVPSYLIHMAKLSTAMTSHYGNPRHVTKPAKHSDSIDGADIEWRRFVRTLIRVALLLYMTMTAVLYWFAYDWRWIFYELNKWFLTAHLSVAFYAFLRNEGITDLALKAIYDAVPVVFEWIHSARRIYQWSTVSIISQLTARWEYLATMCENAVPGWAVMVWHSRVFSLVKCSLRLVWLSPQASDVDAFILAWRRLWWKNEKTETTPPSSPLIQNTPGYFPVDRASSPADDESLLEQTRCPKELPYASIGPDSPEMSKIIISPTSSALQGATPTYSVDYSMVGALDVPLGETADGMSSRDKLTPASRSVLCDYAWKGQGPPQKSDARNRIQDILEVDT
ncbi:hypothetical protein EJ05DRAFT_473224 [Pseudovirgaria hyperparasitica]|uniref:Uncharacterized protein n=1 Tax=Pseudovirgaria hyperparasitica TaxID=470096 RepID=A0A6A6WJE8_9PEZI|nr:uncharacterized protein EJ05DRAFT_473224 [Pseudovirgaria hyperparasitica]KAF2762316.1 hypothetical protein EJ05DRAFT_473224 [Pseudovirgaria hyperparasitica]